jgi:hypothetical protein
MSIGAFFGTVGTPDWLGNEPLEIQIPSVYPFFSIRTTLDGSSYTLTFFWAAREGRWYLTLRDLNEVVLVAGLKLIANWPLLRRSQHIAGIPPGNLTVVDYSAMGGEPPGFEELGARCKVLYYPVSP